MSRALLPVLTVVACGWTFAAAAPAPDFNRDIRPILSDKCFRCHGPDEQDRKGGENGLRLDTPEGSRADLGGGAFAIVPGKPEQSELIARISTEEEDDIMPPVKTGKSLSRREIGLLREWIASGASYAQHWSYEPPRQQAPPAVRDSQWPRGAIDRFVLARLERERLKPQPEAVRAALARRVALDLTGLPPTLAELDQFMADRSSNAYERYVDAQMAKPAYGEHWARGWLDLARYADSKGYADDQPRSIWKYRDYVIDAFNRNLPFDQFTIDQLAGDMLPNPTQAQLFATGFHRNTMNNTEGGTDDEEFRSVAIIDRVNTTMAVWMGTSIACAQCHTHKYDPLTQKEYFQLYAIFNQSTDADRNDESPVLEFYTEQQQEQRTEWETEIASLTRRMNEAKPAHAAAADTWARGFPVDIAWQPLVPASVKSAKEATVSIGPAGEVFVEPGQEKDSYTVELSVPAGGPVTALRLETLPHPSLPGAGAGGAEGNFIVSRIAAGIKGAEPYRLGRYVRVELPGKARVLQLAEVQIFSAGRNIAARGTVAQSSTADGAVAERAIDDQTMDGEEARSFTRTQPDDSPWWEIDLGELEPLDRIVVWGRTGAEAVPAGLQVRVLDAERKPVWEQAARAALNPSRTFRLSDTVEVKLLRVASDFAQPDRDVGAIISDTARRRNPRRAGGMEAGWGVEGATAEPHALIVQPAKPIRLGPGEKLVLTLEQQADLKRGTLNHFRLGATMDPRIDEYVRTPRAEIAVLEVPAEKRTSGERAQLLQYYVDAIAPEFATERKRLATLEQSLDEMPINTSPIMRELPPEKRRKTHVQLRGNFMALGEEVEPGVPAAFPPLPDGVSASRLSLARWLVDAGNPLTARVLANRLWEAIFGIGLVRTTEEFGSQGEMPSHPELLDWLAVDLAQSNWDLKRFIKQLVMSAAYRQSSKVTPEALAADPENRLLSRGPRFRLTAEMVRDQALAVSGLLSAKTHGPSVRPYQPAFDLKAAFGGTLDWKPSEGEDRFRRGLYTEWRRSSPYPSMVTFDAPNREVCTLRRNRSNTPLQALVTLNDPVFVEAALALGRLMMQAGGPVEARLAHGFRRVLARAPARQEEQPLLELYEKAVTGYRESPEDARALVTSPAGPPDANADVAALAAWTTVANVLLNLDETLMKR